MAVKPKFYPILPSRPLGNKQKRSYIGPGPTPCRYNQRKYATMYTKATRASSTYIDTNAVVTMGTSSRSGSVNPGWKQLVASGGDATYPYTRTIHTYKPIVYTCTSESKDYFSQGFGQVHGGSLESPMEWTTLEDRALTTLKRKLNGYIGNAQLAAPIAESKEIGRMIRQINTLGIDTLKAMLAVRKTRGKSLAKQLGNLWLGFGFGVNPLLKDIESAANSILDYTTREDRRVRVVGTASREYTSGTRTAPWDHIAFGLDIGTTDVAVHRQSVQIVAGIDLKLRSGASYSVTDHLGLKITELPGVLWELTAFSWVVDYFATVSPWLDDMFYTLPGVCKYVSRAEKYQCDTTHTPEVKSAEGFKNTFSGTPGQKRYVSFTRVKLATLPTRSLRIKTTDEIASHGLTKLLNLASVIAQKRGPKL